MPKFLGIFHVCIDFATTGSGISGCREDHFIDSCKRDLFEGIIFHIYHISRGQFLHSLQCQRTLNCKLTNIIRSIFQIGIHVHTQFFRPFRTPSPVFFDICCIYNQQIFLCAETIYQKVIHDTTCFIRETAILHLTIRKGSHIIRSKLLYQFESFRAFYPKFSHVRNIKYTYFFANRVVFVFNTRVFNRHIVAGKRSHSCPQFLMEMCKWSRLHFYIV